MAGPRNPKLKIGFKPKFSNKNIDISIFSGKKVKTGTIHTKSQNGTGIGK